MSQPAYNEAEKRQQIERLHHDPRACDLGYPQFGVQTSNSEDGWLAFVSQEYPEKDEWISASFWYDIEAFGAAEHTHRNKQP